MRFSQLTAVASFLACAFANPIKTSETTVKIAKRSEGVHLVNCGNSYSAVVYCSNDSNCNYNPSSNNLCRLTNGHLYTWEAVSGACTFSTGTTFTWYIQGTAQQQPNYAEVGNGDNGSHRFNIFKDNYHVMYTDGSGNQCKSIYYSLDA